MNQIPTGVHEAIREAGWPADALAKAIKCEVAEVAAFLDDGARLPLDAQQALQQWLGHRMGQGADGLLYIDPYRPTQRMPPITAPTVAA